MTQAAARSCSYLDAKGGRCRGQPPALMTDVRICFPSPVISRSAADSPGTLLSPANSMQMRSMRASSSMSC
jgi:hypothetical protein